MQPVKLARYPFQILREEARLLNTRINLLPIRLKGEHENAKGLQNQGFQDCEGSD